MKSEYSFMIFGVICSLLAIGTLGFKVNQFPIKNEPRPPIHFNENKTFKIMFFTDLHYGEGPGSEWGPAQDVKSTKVMTDLLAWEHPDFVVYTGDLMSAEVMFPNGSAYVDMLFKPVVDGGYKWASTYGNHDIGNNVTREEILSTEQKYDNCYTQQGPAELAGNTNYYLPVYPPESIDNSTNIPSLVLWFFDSRGGRNASGGISAYVHENVVEWFIEESNRMKAQWGSVPMLAFFHYPTDEYKPIHEDLANRPECVGQRDDIVTPQEKHTGLIEALVASGMVKASFVGHNHGNGWCCNYENMLLCYNRQSGHGGGWAGYVRGSRVLELNFDKLWDLDTNYIRLETGEVVDRFTGEPPEKNY